MRKIKWVIFVASIVIFYAPLFSQDEGTLAKKGQFTKGKSFYFTSGPSFRFGNNRSDYSGGLNLEAGFLKRVNRILSIGPSISYTKFDYDESISDSFGDPTADGNNILYGDDIDNAYEVRVVYMEGGDLRLISLGLNLKVNFIPFSETKKISVYGIAKPFVLLSKRTELSATVEHYYPPMDPGGPAPDDRSTWGNLADIPEELSPEDGGPYDDWAANTEFSGGMNVAVGAEYTLPSGVAFFLQGTIGLTLPITHINTSEHPNTYDQFADYPFVKKGFTTLNIAIGIAYSF